MKILYYCWDEITSHDILYTFNQLGYSVTTFRHPMVNKLNDPDFTTEFQAILSNEKFDFIFTFDYFPVVSNCALKHNTKYIAWVYDSPLSTLYSETIFNPCNYVFSFDSYEVSKLQSYGVKTIYHMPLAVNVSRLNNLKLKNTVSNNSYIYNNNYKYDVTFLGTLYNDEYNMYDQISYLPPYYKGFFEGIIKTQQELFGIDLPSKLITKKTMEDLKPYLEIPLIDGLFLDEKDFFIHILQKKITVTERLEILKQISSNFRLTHFAGATSPLLTNVDFRGYANYLTEMPYIFNESKINLNISLRSIQSGIPLRCLDIMGAGGFLISNYQSELAESFIPNKEVVLYDSRTDLMNKIEYYLTHDDERMYIANNGYKKVCEHYDYAKVFPKLLEIAKIKKEV